MFKNQPLVEVLRLKSKADIKKAFCGEDSNPNLDSHRFYDFLKLKLGIEINTDDAQKLFYQIDVYNKGFIKYRKLADYLECYEERRLSKGNVFVIMHTFSFTIFYMIRLKIKVRDLVKVAPTIKEIRG
ncbi:hypothetical protein AVEN_227947-1 [Araneus ventricosus]|uniref:EF-hand domain-containing protein n=1 Tax=Araneus ventricosus TaxID=182803 RepID=A0A4Y2RHX0_ARAVE|nr:hypothetical protein AVEN_227947-1 [Araneus ventricosus]